MNVYPIGNNLIVKWTLRYSDGTVFPLSLYDYDLSYRTSRGVKVATDTTVEDNVLRWMLKADDQVVSGPYSLALKISFAGNKAVDLQYNNAFALTSLSHGNGANVEVCIESNCDMIDLKDAVLQARKAMDIAGSAVNTAGGAAATANEAKTIASTANNTSTEAKTIANNAKTVAEKAVTDASRDAAAAQQAAQTVSDHITSLQQAIAELPDGQAVTEKVAEHTIKLTELNDRITNYRFSELNYTDASYSGAYNATSGEFFETEYKRITPFIKVTAGERFSIVSDINNNELSIIAFDAEKNVILASSKAGNYNGNYIVASETSYIRFGCYANYEDFSVIRIEAEKSLALCWTRGIINFDNTNKKLIIPQDIQLRIKLSNILILHGEIPFNWTLNESSLISLYYDYNQQTLKFGYYLDVNDYPIIATFYGTGAGNVDNIVQRVVSSSVQYTIDGKIPEYDAITDIIKGFPPTVVSSFLSLSYNDFVTNQAYNSQGELRTSDYRRLTGYYRVVSGQTFNCSIVQGNQTDLSVVGFDKDLNVVVAKSKVGSFNGQFVVPDGIVYLKFGCVANSEPIVRTIEIANSESEISTIINGFNHRCRDGSVWQPKSLVLQVFSDIHGAENELSRIVDFHTQYNSMIDNCIHLGDIVYDTYADSFDFWNNANAGFILNTIGNHDGRGATVEQTYARYFKPYISQWGVVQPSDAEASGKCYYYKDYATQKIRLIVLDSINFYDTQYNWFVSVLTDAKDNGYSVVVACHYEFADYVKTYNSFDMVTPTIPGEFMQERAETAVDNFIDAGGEFICWLTGHTHSDCFIGHSNHPRQYGIRIDTAKIWDSVGNSDLERIEGAESQDLFNIVAIDTTLKTISILRIGAQWDRLGRHRHTLCWNYATRTLINES